LLAVSPGAKPHSVWSATVAWIFAVVRFIENWWHELLAPDLFAGPLGMVLKVLVALIEVAIDRHLTFLNRLIITVG
jgi:hypothetical protein